MQEPKSEKLQKVIDAAYPEMHRHGDFRQGSWRRHLDLFHACAGDLTGKVILDYGCGPKGGLARQYANVISYDPYVEEYREKPWSKNFHIVFSSDVLEHLSAPDIMDLFEKIQKHSPELIFLAVSLRAANKYFPNGINVHLTVENGSWWFGNLQAFFRKTHTPILAQEDLLGGLGVFCLRRNDKNPAPIPGIDMVTPDE